MYLSGNSTRYYSRIDYFYPMRYLALLILVIFGGLQAGAQQPVLLFFGDSHAKTDQQGKLKRLLRDQGFRIVEMNQQTGRYRLIQPGKRDIVAGVGNGAAAAAKFLQAAEGNQPVKLILLSPQGLDALVPGSVMPAIIPPLQPTAQLYCVFPEVESGSQRVAAIEYAKKWIGFDGAAAWCIGGNWEDSVRQFLQKGRSSVQSSVNPAATPVEGYAKDRHAAKLDLLKSHQYDLLMVGNSITNNFEEPAYQPVWNQFYASRNAINLGYSGYRTENILWNLDHGELDGQHPKVVTIEIGTNNIDEKNYPTRHTASQLAGGIEAIVQRIRVKLPEAKILLLRCFPGNYGGPLPTSHRAILERASDLLLRLADNQHVFYCDVNHVFLNLDGSINQAMMPDWLHPSPAGALAWARAMEPLLAQLMGDASKDTSKAANTAIIPVPKLEEDSYNWYDRHAEVLRIKDSIDPGIVLIGNSITHFWGGLPALKNVDGTARKPNGPNAWASVFGNRRVLNLGFGWDRTQNVLWRLDHGELDGLHPKKVVILIGTNNTSETNNARMNTAEEIAAGIREICLRVRSKVPTAEIVLMAILPREERPDHPRRVLINQTNQILKEFAATNQLRFLDIGTAMLEPDGTLSRSIASDFCHPTEKGYQIWADALKPLLQ